MVGAVLLVTLGFNQLALHPQGLGEGKTWFATYLAIFYPGLRLFHRSGCHLR